MRYHARASATVNTTLAPPFEPGQQVSRAATEGRTWWGGGVAGAAHVPCVRRSASLGLVLVPCGLGLGPERLQIKSTLYSRPLCLASLALALLTLTLAGGWWLIVAGGGGAASSSVAEV
jgi:hypothetical protein